MSEQEQYEGGADDGGIVTTIGGNAQKRLYGFVERLERLAEEKAGIAADIKEVFAEIKDEGFDTKVLRAVLKRRAQDAAKRNEFEDLVDLYEHALAQATPRIEGGE